MKGDLAELRNRKRILKERLFRVVADQTGRLLDPDVLTIVWARRSAPTMSIRPPGEHSIPPISK
ncbi:MAG: hypothetical protein VCA34_06600 [Roseibacillus sp.]